MGVCNCSMFCCMLFCVHSSIAVLLMGKRELVAFLNLSSWCLVMVEWLFLAVPRGCLLFVIVVFPDHTHLLFLNLIIKGLAYQSVNQVNILHSMILTGFLRHCPSDGTKKGTGQKFPTQKDQAVDQQTVRWSKVGLPQPYLQPNHCLKANEHL